MSSELPEVGAARRRRRRRRRVGAAVLVVLAALAVGGDRFAERYAEREIEQRIAAEVGEPVEAELHGWPFVTQLARREFDHVTLDARRVPLESENVTVGDVHVDLYDVSQVGPEALRAGSAQAVATVPFAEVERRANLSAGTLSPGPDGTLRIAQTFKAFGIGVPAVAISDLRTTDNTFVVEPRQVQVAGANVQLDETSRQRLQVGLQVPELPQGSSLEGVDVVEGGLRVRLGGQDVVLDQGAGTPG